MPRPAMRLQAVLCTIRPRGPELPRPDAMIRFQLVRDLPSNVLQEAFALGGSGDEPPAESAALLDLLPQGSLAFETRRPRVPSRKGRRSPVRSRGVFQSKMASPLARTGIDVSVSKASHSPGRGTV